MTQLFRKEAIEAQQDCYLGPIRIGNNPTFTVVALVSIGLAIGLFAFAACGKITKTAKLSGLLTPTLGSLQLASPVTGILTEVDVNEGDAVHAGQKLFVISTAKNSAAGETSALVAQSLLLRRASIEAQRDAQARQGLERTQSLSEASRTVEKELVQMGAEKMLATRRVELARSTVNKFRSLAADGFVASIQVQEKEEELIDQETKLQIAMRNETALQREIQSLHSDREAAVYQTATQRSQSDMALATLQQEVTENDGRKEAVITAPGNGIITAVNPRGGQSIQLNQTVATMIPDSKTGGTSELEAQLFAPSRTAGFLHPNQKVWLRYAGYPYQKFGMHQGTVRSISRTPINPQDLPSGAAASLLSAAQSNEPMYRLIVALQDQTIVTYGKVQPLKPGMALEASVALEERQIWEWLLEPLLAMAKR